MNEMNSTRALLLDLIESSSEDDSDAEFDMHVALSGTKNITIWVESHIKQKKTCVTESGRGGRTSFQLTFCVDICLITMALTSAERVRRYREKLKSNPEKAEEIRKKN
ncbi:hypothetical protein evm_009780 [Chilo suppressalis]|nr:hypothetical protein evm_009780 [Chilo suppressalis]